MTMRQAGLEPLDVYPGSAQPWRCRCTICQRTVTPTHHGVQRGQGGCVYCAGKTVDLGEAAEVMRAAGLEPLETYPGADTVWLCRCDECGSEVSPTYGSVRDGHGCRYCAAQHRGYRRRLDHEVAVEIMRAAELEPLEDYRTAIDPWRCQCSRCHTVLVSLSYNKLQSGRGCPVCRQSVFGFDRTGPGVVYVLEHYVLAALNSASLAWVSSGSASISGMGGICCTGCRAALGNRRGVPSRTCSRGCAGTASART